MSTLSRTTKQLFYDNLFNRRVTIIIYLTCLRYQLIAFFIGKIKVEFLILICHNFFSCVFQKAVQTHGSYLLPLGINDRCPFRSNRNQINIWNLYIIFYDGSSQKHLIYRIQIMIFLIKIYPNHPVVIHTALYLNILREQCMPFCIFLIQFFCHLFQHGLRRLLGRYKTFRKDFSLFFIDIINFVFTLCLFLSTAGKSNRPKHQCHHQCCYFSFFHILTILDQSINVSGIRTENVVPSPT